MAYPFHPSYTNPSYLTLSIVLPSSPSPNPYTTYTTFSQKATRDFAELNKTFQQTFKIASAELLQTLEILKEESVEENEVEPRKEETQFVRVLPL